MEMIDPSRPLYWGSLNDKETECYAVHLPRSNRYVLEFMYNGRWVSSSIMTESEVLKYYTHDKPNPIKKAVVEEETVYCWVCPECNNSCRRKKDPRGQIGKCLQCGKLIDHV